MATALPRNPDLECSICIEMFKTPKILPCGHSFCRDCLERCIGVNRRTFPCPFCKQDVVIPQGGVDKFPTNFSLKTLTDSTSLKPKHYCPNHSKKEVEYYCQTCNLGLCSKCIYKDHNDHETLDLECDSTRIKVVQEFSQSEQFIKCKLTDLEKTYATLLTTSEKLISFCDENCTKIREKTEKIIGELKANCEKRQHHIRVNLNKNESKLRETRQKVMTQILNIKTDLKTLCPTTTDEPSLTLIHSLPKLQDLQKLCETMKTDVPPVTYVEWREGSVNDVFKDIWGSTVTKTLYESSESYVFQLNYKDIKFSDMDYYSEDKNTVQGMVWGCKVFISSYNGCFYNDIVLLPEDNPQVKSCRIQYILTILNKDRNKNVISEPITARFPTEVLGCETEIQWGKLTDPSEGFIDNEGQFLIKFDILHVSK